MVIYEGGSSRTAVGCRAGDIAFREGGSFTTLISSYAADTWYVVQFQWDVTSQSGKFRYRACAATSDITEESWTDWKEGYSAISSYVDKINMYLDGRGGNYFFIDYIAEDAYVEVTTPSWRDQYQTIYSTKSSKGGPGGSVPSAPCSII